MKTPGSVHAAPIGLGLAELTVCNNYVHHVTRHLLDRRDGYRPLVSEMLLDEGLQVPDGVARSASGRWLAISNHDHQAVYLYRDDGGLGPASAPAAVLRGMRYPHGLVFGGDGAVLAADAGSPFVYLFVSESGEWSGEMEPANAIRVTDDETFAAGAYNPQEGGPKGIDLADRLMAVTTQHQPLAFFDLSDVLPMQAVADADPMGDSERARAVLLRHLDAADAAVDAATEAISRASERELQMMLGSRSWRLTAPLRRLSAALSRRRPGRRGRRRP